MSKMPFHYLLGASALSAFFSLFLSGLKKSFLKSNFQFLSYTLDINLVGDSSLAVEISCHHLFTRLLFCSWLRHACWLWSFWQVARILLFLYLFYHVYLHYDQVNKFMQNVTINIFKPACDLPFLAHVCPKFWVKNS